MCTACTLHSISNNIKFEQNEGLYRTQEQKKLEPVDLLSKIVRMSLFSDCLNDI
jgi:hypothetical protein